MPLEQPTISEFSNDLQPDAHNLFQAWRTANPDGFFLNCKTRRSSVLHSSECHHSGDPTWERSEQEGDLGEKHKAFSTDYELLEQWAAQHCYAVRDCLHCIEYTPDEPAIPKKA
ncbi:MAG: hypothetical protein ABI651_05875 [Verrucomicrobiota bacterium]